MAVSTVGNWGANFLIAATFLSLATAITRQGTFFLYAGIAVIAFTFFTFKVPETKGLMPPCRTLGALPMCR